MSLRVGALVVAIGLFVLAWNAGDHRTAEESPPPIPGVTPRDVVAVRRALRDVVSLLEEPGSDNVLLSYFEWELLYKLQLQLNDWSGAARTCFAARRATSHFLGCFDRTLIRATVDALEQSGNPLANLDAMRALPQESWLAMLLEFTRRRVVFDDDRGAKDFIARSLAAPRNHIDPSNQAWMLRDLGFYQAALDQRDDALKTLEMVHRLSNLPAAPAAIRRKIAERIDPTSLRNAIKQPDPPLKETLEIDGASLTVSTLADEGWDSVIAKSVAKELHAGNVAYATQLVEAARREYLIDKDEVLRRIGTEFCEPIAEFESVDSVIHTLGEGSDWEQLLLCEIVRVVCRGGDLQQGERIARLIVNPSRQAQALLEIASLMARAGRLEESLRLAETITPPQMWDDRSGVSDREPFDFRDPITWVRPYEWYPDESDRYNERAEQYAADLARAAMEFYMSRGAENVGELPSRFAAQRDLMRFGNAILQKMITAQAEAGDIRGALRWCQTLREPKMPKTDDAVPPEYLAEYKRIEREAVQRHFIRATIGVAEGVVECKTRRGAVQLAETQKRTPR